MEHGYCMGLDAHCTTCELVCVTPAGRRTRRWSTPTAIPPLVEAIERVPRPRRLALEEGPMADWLMRGLAPHVDELVVCNPRHNRLIAEGGDKEDDLDAEKLANLLRGGFLSPVHHPETWAREAFKRHVMLYHSRVGRRVREANTITNWFRRFGLVLCEKDFAEASSRGPWLAKLPPGKLLRADTQILFEGYDRAAWQEEVLRRQLVRHAREQEPIRRLTALPGVKWIHASTFFVLVDTPWRFRSKSALWKYMGIGLERRGSGKGPRRLHTPQSCNRRLKGTILSAAKSAIASKESPFAAQYRRLTERGLSPPIAERTVARSLAATMWGMLKSGDVYRPELVGTPG